jgi:hypothetical protein
VYQGVRRVLGRLSRPCLAPWMRAKVPSSVMAHRCFWRWRVQRLFGLLLSWLQAGPLLLRCGHLRGCLVRGPLHRCAVEWSTCEASNTRDTALTAEMRVRGGSGQVLLPCAALLAAMRYSFLTPEFRVLGLDVLGMTEVLKVPGLLFAAKELCCLKLGSVGLGRQWRRTVQLRSPYRVLRREYCLSRIPLQLMRSNSWVLTCS